MQQALENALRIVARYIASVVHLPFMDEEQTRIVFEYLLIKCLPVLVVVVLKLLWHRNKQRRK